MYKGQEYGGSGGGGEMPSCYDDLTELLENEVLTADTTNNVLRGSFEGELKLGYIQDAYKIDENGDPIVWGDTEQTGLTGAIGSMCDRIAALEEGGSGGGGEMPADYDGFTWLLDNGYIEFNTENVPYGIKLNNLAAIDLDHNGDIVKSGYWAGSTGGGISDSGSLVTFMEALCTVVNTTGEDLDNLENTVGGLSDTVDTLSNNFDSLNEELAGFTSGYITFEDSNNMTFNDIALHLDDSDIVNESGYWGAWKDEQTQESSNGTQTNNLAEALSNICRRLEAIEAVLQNQ